MSDCTTVSSILLQPLLGAGSYHWNDWNCDNTARFICQANPLQVRHNNTGTGILDSLLHIQESPSTTSQAPSTTTTSTNTDTTTQGTKHSHHLVLLLLLEYSHIPGSEDCPFLSSPVSPSRSIFCPQSYCPAVIIASKGGALQHQPHSLGCYNYEGSLLGKKIKTSLINILIDCREG